MTHDRNHHPGRHTWRIVLAKLCLDRQAEAIIADKVDGCAQCWQSIAEELPGVVRGDTIAAFSVLELYRSGLVEGEAIRWVAYRIACALCAAELNARHDDEGAAHANPPYA